MGAKFFIFLLINLDFENIISTYKISEICVAIKIFTYRMIYFSGLTCDFQKISLSVSFVFGVFKHNLSFVTVMPQKNVNENKTDKNLSCNMKIKMTIFITKQRANHNTKNQHYKMHLPM